MNAQETILGLYHASRSDEKNNIGTSEMKKSTSAVRESFQRESKRLAALTEKGTVTLIDILNFNRSIARTLMKLICTLNADILNKPVLNETAYLFGKIE